MIEPRIRDYEAIEVGLREGASRTDRMRAVVEALWSAFGRRAEGDRGISWVGFYLGPGERTEEGEVVGADEMILVVREPKPACSPLSLKGACGQCWSSCRSLVVTDVANLGEDYVACDPRDRSEVVVPCFDEVGGAARCWGVLDIDSFDANAFSVDDAHALAALLRRVGLTAREPEGPPRIA